MIAAAIDKASISHGNHCRWFGRSVALKNPARSGLQFLSTYRVAPSPYFLKATSVTIHNGSPGLGKVMALWLMPPVLFERLQAAHRFT